MLSVESWVSVAVVIGICIVFWCRRALMDCVLCVFCSCRRQMPSFKDKINTVIIRRRRVKQRVHQRLLITTKRSSSILSTEAKMARSCRRGIRFNWFISQTAFHWKSLLVVGLSKNFYICMFGLLMGYFKHIFRDFFFLL